MQKAPYEIDMEKLANYYYKFGLYGWKLSDEDRGYLIPCIVNLAFSAEIAIKMQLPNKQGGHDLESLFNLLDQEIQESVINSVINKYHLIESICLQDKKLAFSCKNSIDFFTSLSNCKFSFVEARYIYEEKYLETNKYPTFMLILTASLLNRDLLKDLRSF